MIPSSSQLLISAKINEIDREIVTEKCGAILVCLIHFNCNFPHEVTYLMTYQHFVHHRSIVFCVAEITVAAG